MRMMIIVMRMKHWSVNVSIHWYIDIDRISLILTRKWPSSSVRVMIIIRRTRRTSMSSHTITHDWQRAEMTRSRLG